MNHERLKISLRFVILVMLLGAVLFLTNAILQEFSAFEPEPGVVALISAALTALTGGFALAVKSFFPDSKD